MSKYKVLILEDESNASQRLQKMIEETNSNFEIEGIVVSIEDAKIWWKQNDAPDLIFADIELADGKSFIFFEEIKTNCPIIFSTAYDEYALQAFKLNSIDYLLKPIKQKELDFALTKFENTKTPTSIDFSQIRELINQNKSENYKERFLVKYGTIIKSINVDQIAYVYTENKTSFFVLFENNKFIVDYSIEELENQLNPKNFFRINRQLIVSIASIAEMRSYTKGRVILTLQPKTNIETIVSVERSANFKKWLEK